MHGELDISTAPKLARVVEAVAERVSDLVVVMTQVWFIDATGLRRLLRARDHVDARGGRLALTRGPDAVMRIIELTALSDDLLILESPDAPFDEPLSAA